MLSFLLLFVVLIKLIVIIVVLQIEFQDSLGKALLIYEFVVVVQKKKGDRGGGGGENTSNTKSVNRSKPNDKMCICVCECVYVAYSKEKCTISFFFVLKYR